MANQAGAFHFDPRPQDPQGAWDHEEPCLAMRQDRETVWWPMSDRSGPHAGRSGLVLTWDGRLDNRDDLLIQLGAAAPRNVSDAELALAAFERSGPSGLTALIGDWSLCVWDRQRRTVHLARDYMGARPLYYCLDADGVVWSTSLAELVERTGRIDTLDDRFAASFMSLRLSPESTPYAGIHAVPAGTCLSIDSQGLLRRTRFWTLQPAYVRYADPRDYDARLRELWSAAVGARLRTDAVVWAELSGGLDSSSVVCMADRLIAGSHVRARGLRLVSHATLRSPDGDERRFIAEIERQVGVTSEIVGVEDHQGRTDPEHAWITPHAVQGVGLETARRVLRGGGAVVLSGRLGDAVMGCQPDNSVAVVEDFARGALVTALGKLRRWSRATRKPFIEIASRLLIEDRTAGGDTGTALLTPRLRALLSSTAHRHDVGHVRRSKRALARMVLGYSAGGRLEVPHYPSGITYAYPFSHRPLVEFMLAIPGEELSAPGLTRALMRRAFGGIVPPRILGRISKGYYPPAAFRAARRLAALLPPAAELEVVERGWIDPDRLATALRTLADGGGETGGDIHCVLRLEGWLQARRLRARIPPRKEVNSNAVLHA